MIPATQAALRIDDTYVRIMCEVLEEHGIDSREILARAGLPRRLPERGTTTSAETSIAFRRAFAAATDRRREIWSIVAGRLVLQTAHPASRGCTGTRRSAPVRCPARTRFFIGSMRGTSRR